MGSPLFHLGTLLSICEYVTVHILYIDLYALLWAPGFCEHQCPHRPSGAKVQTPASCPHPQPVAARLKMGEKGRAQASSHGRHCETMQHLCSKATFQPFGVQPFLVFFSQGPKRGSLFISREVSPRLDTKKEQSFSFGEAKPTRTTGWPRDFDMLNCIGSCGHRGPSDFFPKLHPLDTRKTL